MPATRKPLSALAQLANLTVIQLSNWRWSWRGTLVTGIAAPLLSVVALGFFARDSGPEALSYVLIGNVVLALMFTLMTRVTSNFAFMRANGALDYFASLPIHKHNLILATILAFFLLSLPAVFVTIFVGAWILGVPLAPNLLFLPILPLTAIPLAAVGAYIGIRTRTLEDATSIATMLTLVMLGLGPVLIPPDRLPDLLLTLGYLSPATYAASALRQTLLGPITPRLLLDIAVLLLLSIILLWAVARKMQWRERI